MTVVFIYGRATNDWVNSERSLGASYWLGMVKEKTEYSNIKRNTLLAIYKNNAKDWYDKDYFTPWQLV